MAAGEEGARWAGIIGMVAGVSGAVLGEGYRAAKIAKAAVLPGMKIKDAVEEYERSFNHVKEKAKSLW
jgi:hypothetical protein